MKNKNYWIIVFITIIGFSMSNCATVNENVINEPETKQIIVTILNENDMPISAVGLSTSHPSGSGVTGVAGMQGDILFGDPVNILKNEIYISPLITVRRLGDNWILLVNINNTPKQSFKNYLAGINPLPNILALKYTINGEIEIIE